MGDRGNSRYSPDKLEEMRELYEKEGFRYLLLDWKMPGHDGLELLEMLRSDFRYKQLAIILITAESGEAVAEKAFRLGE